ncbi:carotenoid oxygenase family protein [Stakelama tenebrarum]|uniref:Dioxygenase n=1 Tax=Stakelama tenebrarum TaxID=2711215 RepID=A0A6G6Y2B4_9SPHN|nr:carotenoid oxygenase family protein [Sphingosinithalassobacter tenebrarum]QIG78981.1 carotenoid oxygenase [Sphingosinithalassobacter tenebrarum]
MLNRRAFLGTGLIGAGLCAGAAILPPEKLYATMLPADWTLGARDIEADVAPHAMRLVAGRAPDGFKGVLYRNGPAKFRRPGGSATHWFDGDGMVRRFAIDRGEARMAARFVATEKRRQDAAAGAMVMPGFGSPARDGAVLTSTDSANAANTSVLLSGGDLLALWEPGSPYRLDPETLATRGLKTFRDDLAHMPFLAHPRVEPDGTVWNLGVAGKRAIVWKLSAGGALADTKIIDLPRASYIHDFSATARHLVIVLQPWVYERNTIPAIEGMAWQPETGTQILVIDKDDFTQRRLYEVPAFFAFHMDDAWEEADGTIRFGICVTPEPKFVMEEARLLLLGQEVETPLPILSMITLHPDGRTSLDRTGVSAEFPQNDRTRSGLPRSLTVHTGMYGSGRPFPRAVGVYDWARQTNAEFDFGAGHLVEEFLYVPRGSEEGDGWLVGTTLNLAERATELHVLDARHVAAGPVASWRGDVALPVTFHGTFAAG